MKRERGHKARLYPDSDQLSALEDQGHASRAMWNLLHDWWTMASENRRVQLKEADQAIRQARKDIDWLSDLPAQAAQAVLKTYFRAWGNYWEGRAKAPTFKARFRSRMAIDVPQGRDLGIRRITRRWGVVKVPKVGMIRFRWTKDLPVGKHTDVKNKVTGARLVREANGWHVVFRVRTETKELAPQLGPGVGIDRGVAKPLALSDGSFREHDPWLSRLSRNVCADWRRQRHVRSTLASAVREHRTVSSGPMTRSQACAREPSAAPWTGSTRPPPDLPRPSA
ncbi:RNA-guided endonuclease InsQ/TnpB family protein [Allosalinactinospora lopnorensis]|uniref:RNA-guided endonuclease InsQ/TnpB family protein n=1 Tax=Allosalinactinospora lopnorensis TaxID=1352348 RepID=UPI000AD92F69|nr:hypothetical protein [Allosalinactinospora lopnorensis]